MTEGRRFEDTGPIELDPITESDWSKLSESERADLLLERHHRIMAGQARIWNRVEAQARAIQDLGTRVDEKVLPMLEENTLATKKVAEGFEKFSERAESLLDAWSSAKGFGTVVGWAGSALRNVAWIAIPAAAAVGAWQALLAWLKLGGPK